MAMSDESFPEMDVIFLRDMLARLCFVARGVSEGRPDKLEALPGVIAEAERLVVQCGGDLCDSLEGLD